MKYAVEHKGPLCQATCHLSRGHKKTLGMLPVAGFKELDPSPRCAEAQQGVPYRS